MKVASLTRTVVLLLLWNAAESATLLSTSSAASAEALVHDRESFEARSHTQLNKWCSATLPAQGSRRSALQHLLLQAQSSETAPESPDAGSLVQLESQAATFGGQLERTRLEMQASQSMKTKELATLKLDLDDAARDVEALQRAYDHLGGAKKTPVNEGLKAAAKLLDQAKEVKRQAQAKVTLLQSQATAGSGANLSQLETQYRNKKADIVSFQHQLFTTQRSLDVLTSALEDESGYLSDLQSVCGAESRVHERLEKHVMPMLQKLAQTEGAAPEPAAPSKPAVPAAAAAPKVVAPKPAVVKAAPPTPVAAVAVKPAAPTPVTVKPAAPKPVAAKPAAPKPVAVKPAAPKPVAAKPAAPKPVAVKPTAVKPVASKPVDVKPAAPKPVAVKPAAAAPKPAAVKPAAVKPAAPKPVAVKPAAPKPVAVKPAAPKPAAVKPAAVKPVVHKKTAAAKPVAAKPEALSREWLLKKAKAHKAKKAHKTVVAAVAKAVVQKKLKVHKAKPVKKVAAKAPPVHKKAPTVQKKVATVHKKVQKPTTQKKAPKKAHPVAAKPVVAAKPAAAVAPKIKDPFADDDDDDSAPPAAPVAAVAKPAAPAVSKAAAAPPAAPTIKDPFADDDDDDTAAPPPPPTTKHHQHASAPPAPKAPPAAAAADLDDAQDDAAPPPTPPAHAKKHATKALVAKAAKKDQFMDAVYDSAAGNMPSGYAAWKPGGASASESPLGKPVDAAEAKKKMMAMLGGGDDDDDSAPDSTPPKVAPAAPPPQPVVKATPPAQEPAAAAAAPEAPAPVAAPVADDVPAPAKAAEAAGVKAAEAAFDADDDSAASPPAVKPAKAAETSLVDTDEASDSTAKAEVATSKAASAKAAAAAFDGDDDSFDAKAAFDAAKPKAAAPAVAAVQEELSNDEAVDKAFPDGSASQLQMPKPQKSHRSKKAQKANFMDDAGVYDAAAGNLPTAYAAWTPAEQAASDSSKKATLAQMEADFDDDDDTPTPAPKRRPKHHRHAPAPAPPPPPPRAQPADDGVVYDDDDLPKHHAQSMRGLEGGWQAFMKKPEKKVAHTPKLDPDVAIMESLYTKDGGLPSQYTAWSPEDAPKPAAPPPPQPEAEAQDDNQKSDDGDDKPMDLEAAAKNFAADPEHAFDFLQVDSQAHDLVSNLLLGAAAPIAFLEASSVSVDMTRMAAASSVLEQYAEVLKSKPLRQLAKAKLSEPKLTALYQQLRNVDPLVGKVPAASQGKQAQAEQMCKYFQEHMQAAAPVQKAVSLVEAASNELAESVSRHAALLEEIDARTQLQRTMEQDLSSLDSLVVLAKQGEDTSAFQALGKQLTGADAMAVGASAEAVEAAHAEVKDLLDIAVQKRSAVLQAQRNKLTELQVEVQKADVDVAQKKTRAATSQASMETARKKLAGITTSCDATLDALARRRHAGHMEAHAIGMALKVLGSQ